MKLASKYVSIHAKVERKQTNAGFDKSIFSFPMHYLIRPFPNALNRHGNPVDTNVFEHHELMTKLTLQEGVDLFSFLIEYDLGQILVGRSAKITSCQNFCHKNTLYTGVFKVEVNVHYFSDDIVRAGGSGDIVPFNMKKQAIRLVGQNAFPHLFN